MTKENIIFNYLEQEFLDLTLCKTRGYFGKYWRKDTMDDFWIYYNPDELIHISYQLRIRIFSFINREDCDTAISFIKQWLGKRDMTVSGNITTII